MVRRLAKEGRGPRPAVTPEAPANSRGPTPCLVDARLREAPLSLAELRRMVPSAADTERDRVLACLEPCPRHGRDLPRASRRHGPGWWRGPAMAGARSRLGMDHLRLGPRGIVSLGHDCGHGCFSNRKWINTLIGHLCMSPLGNSLVAWQIAHDHHHRHTQLQGQEVDWSANLRTRAQMRSPSAGNPLLLRSGYRLPCGMVVWIVSNTLRRAFNLRSMMTSVEWRAWKKPLRRSKPVDVLVGCLDLRRTVAVGRVLGHAQVSRRAGGHRDADRIVYHHDPAREFPESRLHRRRGGIRRAARWLQPSTFDFRSGWSTSGAISTFHIPHHVAPEIPWYHLPESACILSAALPGRYMESRFGVEHLKFFGERPFSNRSRTRAISSWIRPAESDTGVVVALSSFPHPFSRSIERFPQPGIQRQKLELPVKVGRPPARRPSAEEIRSRSSVETVPVPDAGFRACSGTPGSTQRATGRTVRQFRAARIPATRCRE